MVSLLKRFYLNLYINFLIIKIIVEVIKRETYIIFEKSHLALKVKFISNVYDQLPRPSTEANQILDQPRYSSNCSMYPFTRANEASEICRFVSYRFM